MNLGDLYVDLGTANTIVYSKTHGLIANEPSVITLKTDKRKSKNYYTHGIKSKLMLGKAPEFLSVHQPLKEGVITDLNSAYQMMKSILKNTTTLNFFSRPRLVISLPQMVTEHERNAVLELGERLGARRVDLLSEPMAAAIGAGIPVTEKRGFMIVDIGGGTSEVAIISLGGIVASNATRIGGLSLDAAIIEHVRFKYNFLIGEQTAEFLKSKVAHASPSQKHLLSADICGIDLSEAMPRRKKITSLMIHKPVDEFIKSISAMILLTFQECPPEISADLAENGILLAGGGSLITGLSERLAQETKISVKLCQNPLLTVAHGGAKVLQNNLLFESLIA